MILAEELVMGPSGFSYLAGILSEGQKLARAPWWHHLPGLPDWILVGADGSAVTTERQAEGN